MSSGNVTFEVFNRTAFSVQIVRQTAAEREVLAQLADETSSGKEHATLTLPSGTALVATNASNGEIVSRYTALRKYPQWHIFADELKPVEAAPTPMSDQRKAKMEHFQSVTAEMYKYLLTMSLREHEALKGLREETFHTEGIPAQMQTAPDEAQFLGLFVKAVQVKRAIEVGVFTGYSALSVALNLPADGKLVALDINDEWASIGRKYWKQAGVAERIDLRLGPAVDSLKAMLSNGENGTYDFAYIDADKPNYWNYFELLMQLVRVGGVIAVDNVLWSGKLINEADQSPQSVALRAFNEKLSQRTDVQLSMLGIADGLFLALRTK